MIMTDEMCEIIEQEIGKEGFDKLSTIPGLNLNSATMRGYRKKMGIFADFKLLISLSRFMEKYHVQRDAFYYWQGLFKAFQLRRK